jgi:hypothetical protein
MENNEKEVIEKGKHELRVFKCFILLLLLLLLLLFSIVVVVDVVVVTLFEDRDKEKNNFSEDEKIGRFLEKEEV